MIEKSEFYPIFFLCHEFLPDFMVHEYKGKYKFKIYIYTNFKNNNNIKLRLKAPNMIEKSEFYPIFFSVT